MWKKAKVVAVNYDGTYDLQFEMNHGPYREQRMKGLKGRPTLSLRREEQFKGYAADHMPASWHGKERLAKRKAILLHRMCIDISVDALSDAFRSFRG